MARNEERWVVMLVIHRAERANTLVRGLAQLLADPLPDPFAAEVVAVPAKGVERWLQQQLSGALGAGPSGDGIAANIVYPSPGRLVDEVITAISGRDTDDDPWAAGPLTWATLRVIDASMGEAWCSVLATSLGGRGAATDDHRRGRRWSTASHIAGLFRSYLSQRPSMIVDWASGKNTDGAGKPLPPDLHWQPELWRRVRDATGVPSSAELLDEVCERLTQDAAAVTSLPRRLSLFGATRSTAAQRRVLHALSAHRDVHLWLPHPSPAAWTGAAEPAESSAEPRQLAVAGRRSESPPPQTTGHPLVSSLARDVRELRPLLLPLADRDLHHADTDVPTTVLGRVQADIAADRPPTGPVSPGLDGSVQIHACHGPARQVDVLRDALLHLFEADPTMEPRDVVIMCPDVETFAPLVRAAFGNAATANDPVDPQRPQHPAHRLRVRLADRGLRRTNPVLDVVAAMVDMAGGRVTATLMADLAAMDAVRCRFRFVDDDLERLREWIRVSGARWGIDALQRETFGMKAFRQNTFTSAMDRLLLGVAADETTGEWLGLALPVDDVDGNDIDLVGRFAELVDRVSVVLHAATGEHSARNWRATLQRAADLLTDVPATEEWHRVDAAREIAAAFDGAGEVPLVLADVRSMLRDRLAGKPTRSNFRTGELTVCTMVPMRSVPHRVVVLLGLDDEVFPRSGHVDGDDVLARDPLVGERDVRSEDRQLLLDAVMSAQDTLMLFHTGANPVSGQPEPPAIPLSEVIDVVAATAGVDPVTRHPLQPFDPAVFDPASPVGFDTAALDGARAASQESTPRQGFLDAVLSAQAPSDVDLADLVAFAQNPITAFLRQRLKIRLSESTDELQDGLTVDADSLEVWDIGERMLRSLLAGTPVETFRAAEWRRGTLPPFEQGSRLLERVESDVLPIAEAAREIHVGQPDSLDVVVDLGGGRRLTGTVPGVHGTTIARTGFSRMAPKKRLEAWVHLLAVTAHGRTGDWTAVTTARGRGPHPVERSELHTPPDPLRLLAELVDLRDRGLREPLPLTLKAGEAYVERALRGRGEDLALADAARVYSGTFGDVVDPGTVLIHGTGSGFEVITSQVPTDEEASWSADSTRFGVLARRLWLPLFTHEKQVRR